MKKIVLATRNKNKVLEIKSILDDFEIEVLPLDSFDGVPEVVEDGVTFEDNAKKKAREVSVYTGHISMADDSGLCVDVLDGAPGVYSSRYAHINATDEENNKKILHDLQNIELEKRKAFFVCCISLFDGERELFTLDGKCEGLISDCERGAKGFGYDPLFIPKGYSETFAELGLGIKNKISHRKKALLKVNDFFNNELKSNG